MFSSNENLLLKLDQKADKARIICDAIQQLHASKVVILTPTNAWIQRLASEMKSKFVDQVRDMSRETAYFLSQTIKTWNRIWDENRIFVMSPQLFLRGLQHGYLGLDSASLVVLDNIQNCSGASPYSRFLNDYYANSMTKPKIIGICSNSSFKSDNQLLELQKLLQTTIVHNMERNVHSNVLRGF